MNDAPNARRLAAMLDLSVSAAQERLAKFRAGAISREQLLCPPHVDIVRWAREHGLPPAEEIAANAGIGRDAALQRMRLYRAGTITREQLVEDRAQARKRCGVEKRIICNRFIESKEERERLEKIKGMTALEREWEERDRPPAHVPEKKPAARPKPARSVALPENAGTGVCPATGGNTTRIGRALFEKVCKVKLGRLKIYKRQKQAKFIWLFMRCEWCKGREENWPAELVTTDGRKA